MYVLSIMVNKNLTLKFHLFSSNSNLLFNS